METQTKETVQILSPAQFIAHWQGHRNLTRRVIEAFPEADLFNFSIGGMRPFASMVKELLAIAAPGVKGMVTGEWEDLNESLNVDTKEELLKLWDQATEEMNEWWAKLPEDQYQETVTAFGQYEDKVYCSLLYFIDNEIHHRGQGFVYLRALGITPPNFWER